LIKQLRLGELQVLGDLPSLLCLRIYLQESPQETLRISTVVFQFLKELCFYPLDGNLASLNRRNRKKGLSLMFEAGAMPRLELLHLDLLHMVVLISASVTSFLSSICGCLLIVGV
jgi:hypothetical protein